jgi:hypothetical protein
MLGTRRSAVSDCLRNAAQPFPADGFRRSNSGPEIVTTAPMLTIANLKRRLPAISSATATSANNAAHKADMIMLMRKKTG